MRCEAVVVAAGSGRRFGGGVPKQFQLLAGSPVVVRACRAVLRASEVDGVVLVLPEAILEAPPDWLRRLSSRVRPVAGGSSRTGSVRRGVASVDPEADVVLVHDGVRPLVRPGTVTRVLRAAADGPVVPTARVTDTVKRVDGDGRVVETVDRTPLRLAQTPQGFPASLLQRVLDRGEAEGLEVTDEASLCERFGETVRTVPGDRENLKITRPGDLRLAELLLQARGRGRGPGAGG
jgi:2-C-methyl-D-erythritol 4-phosphate cytidylyltransferase